MVVIPGLSRLLEAAGKRVTAWDDTGSRLVVEAGSVVKSAVCPTAPVAAPARTAASGDGLLTTPGLASP